MPIVGKDAVYFADETAYLDEPIEIKEGDVKKLIQQLLSEPYVTDFEAHENALKARRYALSKIKRPKSSSNQNYLQLTQFKYRR